MHIHIHTGRRADFDISRQQRHLALDALFAEPFFEFSKLLVGQRFDGRGVNGTLPTRECL